MASGVFTNLDTRHMGRRNKMLLADFTYTDAVFGEITAPKGSETDFASIYSMRTLLLFVLFALLAGYGDKAATTHDFLYGGGKTVLGAALTRQQADEVYFRALRDEGTARWRAYIFFYGVRFFGQSHWKGLLG